MIFMSKPTSPTMRVSWISRQVTAFEPVMTSVFECGQM